MADRVRLVVGGVFASSFIVAIGVAGWQGQGPLASLMLPTPTHVEVNQIDGSIRAVRTEGTLHQSLRVKQIMGNIVTLGNRAWWVFPLFPRGDLRGHEISVLVMTRKEPGHRVDLEDREVSGLVQCMPSTELNEHTRHAYLEVGYTFQDEICILREIASKW